MSAVIEEMRAIVRQAALPAMPGDQVQAAIGRAARRLKMEYGRARSMWYGDRRVAVRADEADRLRALHLKRQEARAVELRAELATIEQQHAALAARLRRIG